MRILMVSIVGAALLLGSAARAEQPRYRLAVNGLACPFCAYGIEKALLATEGVTEIVIDIDAGLVRVAMSPGAALARPEAAALVADAGFTLADYQADPGPTHAQSR